MNKVFEDNKNFYPHIVLNKLAEIAFKSDKNYEKAREYFILSIQLIPKPELWIKCGKCWEKLRKYDKAAEDYQMSVNLDENYAFGYLKLGSALYRSGNRSEGLKT